MHFLTLRGNSTCSSPEVVLAFLLYEGSTIHNASDQFVSCVYSFFVRRLRFSSISTDKNLKEYAPTSNSCISTPIENWTHVYMNLFTRISPYFHLLKYMLFLLKHPVYFWPSLLHESAGYVFCNPLLLSSSYNYAIVPLRTHQLA